MDNVVVSEGVSLMEKTITVEIKQVIIDGLCNRFMLNNHTVMKSDKIFNLLGIIRGKQKAKIILKGVWESLPDIDMDKIYIPMIMKRESNMERMV